MWLLFIAIAALSGLAAAVKLGFLDFLEQRHDLIGGIADFGTIILLGVTAVSAVIGLWLKFSQSGQADAARPMSAREAAEQRRDLLALLRDVRRSWVTGYLEGSLFHRLMLELGKELRPDAVEYPWRMQIERPGGEPHTLPAGQSLTAVFHDYDDRLLILGDPGSGKTISLLTLARDLLDAAEADAERPIPVVFNLSSWATRRLPLIEWMRDELREKYLRPAKVAAAWLAAGRLLPLLDGLDEVPEPHRAACAAAIDEYVRDHGGPGLAVCCRERDYRALPQALRLPTAVRLQPLTEAQIDDYLDRAGAALDGLRRRLSADTELRQLARSPLMLNIMSVVYANRPADAGHAPGAPDGGDRESALLDRYVERMFERKGQQKPPYPPHRTLRWLSWLAMQLRRHAQTQFLLEDLQGDWTNRMLLMLVWGVFCAGIGALLGLVGGGLLHMGWWGRPMDAITGPLYGAGAGGIFGLFLGTLFSSGPIEPAEEFVLTRPRTSKRILVALLGGLAGFVAGNVLLLAFLYFSGFGAEIARFFESHWKQIVSLYIAFVVTGILWLLFVESRTNPKRLKPNQGIHASIRNTWRFSWVGIALGLILVYIHYLTQPYAILDLEWGVVHRLSLGDWLVSALGGFWLAFLLFGGIPVLGHYLLRLSLYLQGRTPWRYVHFLDYASRLILLQKVGGGYVFIHRLLLKRLADRYERGDFPPPADT